MAVLLLNKNTTGERDMSTSGPQEQLDEFFEYMAKFAQKHSAIAQSFMTLTGNVMQDGALKAKEKELIALGIAVGLRCSSCICAHTKAALGHGATSDEILEAASVAVNMQGGPGMSAVVEVMKALEAFEER